MKKIYLLLTVIPFLIIAADSCKPEANDPKSAAKSFTEALMNDDFKEAARFATNESKSTIEMLKTAKNMSDMSGSKESMNIMKEAKGKTITYSDAKMDGTERAIVTVMADGKELTPLILKKEEGFWKVAYDIASIMDGERLNLKDNPTPDNEQADSFYTNLESMNDSIENAYKKAREDLDTTKTDTPKH